MIDTITLGILFLIGIATSAYATSNGGAWNGLGGASVGLGWLLTFFVLAILIFTVAYTLARHGTSQEIWQTTPTDLEAQGGGSEKGGLPVPDNQQPLVGGAAQPVMFAQPMQGHGQFVQPMQQPMQQGGFVVQPTATGTSGELTSNATGTTYPPQQYVQQATQQQASKPSYTQPSYTVNLAQPTPGQSSTTYNVELAQQGSAGLPSGAAAPRKA